MKGLQLPDESISFQKLIRGLLEFNPFLNPSTVACKFQYRTLSQRLRTNDNIDPLEENIGFINGAN